MPSPLSNLPQTALGNQTMGNPHAQTGGGGCGVGGCGAGSSDFLTWEKTLCDACKAKRAAAAKRAKKIRKPYYGMEEARLVAELKDHGIIINKEMPRVALLNKLWEHRKNCPGVATHALERDFPELIAKSTQRSTQRMDNQEVESMLGRSSSSPSPSPQRAPFAPYDRSARPARPVSPPRARASGPPPPLPFPAPPLPPVPASPLARYLTITNISNLQADIPEAIIAALLEIPGVKAAVAAQVKDAVAVQAETIKEKDAEIQRLTAKSENETKRWTQRVANKQKEVQGKMDEIKQIRVDHRAELTKLEASCTCSGSSSSQPQAPAEIPSSPLAELPPSPSRDLPSTPSALRRPANVPEIERKVYPRGSATRAREITMKTSMESLAERNDNSPGSVLEREETPGLPEVNSMDQISRWSDDSDDGDKENWGHKIKAKGKKVGRKVLGELSKKRSRESGDESESPSKKMRTGERSVVESPVGKRKRDDADEEGGRRKGFEGRRE